MELQFPLPALPVRVFVLFLYDVGQVLLLFLGWTQREYRVNEMTQKASTQQQLLFESFWSSK